MSNNINHELQQTLEEINRISGESVIIPVETVREWMSSYYLEVQGEVFDLLFNHSKQLELPNQQEIYDFYITYLEQCLRKNLRNSHIHSRYMAGHAIRAWFERMWLEQPRPNESINLVRWMLERLCHENDKGINDAIVTSILEHLFTNPTIAAFFFPWTQNSELKPIYDEAIHLSSSAKNS